LRSTGFVVLRGVSISPLKLDVVAVGDVMMSRGVVKKSDTMFVYTFDVRTITSRKLLKNSIEQAVTRLFTADYAYIVVPRNVAIETSKGGQKSVDMPKLVQRAANGPLSRRLGVVAVEPPKIEIIRWALRSDLIVDELRNRVLEKAREELLNIN
jgi:hypothetical protein